MSTAANRTTHAGHSSSVPAVGETPEADWIARALRAQVVMVPEAGHYPQSQRPDITTGAVLRFLESVTGRA
jgi:pimeloyl-ACP methyl ester carboxylesterase